MGAASQLGSEGFLFSGRSGENVAFGLPDASAEEVAAAARAVGAEEFIAQLEAQAAA